MVTTRKWTLWTALLCFMLISLSANAYNKLSIPDVLIQRGGSIDLPVNLENDDQIVALQFTLTVPNGFSLDVNSTRTTERSSGHSLRVKKMQGNDYLCMVYSADNAELSGNRGAVMYVKLKAPNNATEGDEFPMTMTEAVGSDIDMNNVLDETNAGTITIARFPDLVVTNVTTDKNRYAPEDHIVVSWNVQNTGQMPTQSGWSEQIVLVDEDGTTCLLGTTYYNTTLEAGGTVSRQADIIIPRVPGIHGTVTPQVRLVPNANTGEGPEAQGNNTATGTNVQLDAKLYIDLSRYSVAEESASQVRMTLTRSGKRTAAIDLTLSCNDSRVEIPATVTITEGQSSVYANATVIDNDVVDDDDKAVITAIANGYPDGQATLTIVDNEHPFITVTASQREVTEGESFNLDITLSKAPKQPMTVKVVCNEPSRFEYSTSIIFNAGQTTATVPVTAIDDNEPALDQEVTFVVTADGYDQDEAWVTLHDNDIPTMELTLSPTTVSESSGPSAIMATLRRLDHADSKITVKLSDDSQGDLSYPATLILEPGILNAEFTIGVVNNNMVDGDRTVTLTAAVYMKSCSCTAGDGTAGSISQQVLITDDDGPALSIKSSHSTVAQGSEFVLTISRNAQIDQPLTVNLINDNNEAVTHDNQVTFAADETSVQVPVSATMNPVGDIVVSFLASADGYSSGACWVMITDQKLPDAQFSSFTVDRPPLGITPSMNNYITMTVTNLGLKALPDATKINIYIDGKQKATFYTGAELAPGESETISGLVQMPEQIGSHKAYAYINEEKQVKETIYANNKSEEVTFTVVSPYDFTLETDKITYGTGETVVLTGTAISNQSPNGVTLPAANTPIEIYLINTGSRQVIETTTDENGEFSTTYNLKPGQMGHFMAGACYPGDKTTEEMAAFDVYGLTAPAWIVCDVALNEPQTFEFNITNQALLQHNVRVVVSEQPADFELSFDNIPEIGNNQQATMTVTVTGTAVTENNRYIQVPIEIVTDEGAVAPMTLYLYCRPAKSVIKASENKIVTTLTQGTTREYPITITNTGVGTTGDITVLLPDVDWLETATPQTMAPLAAGESAELVLRFKWNDNMQLNVRKSATIAINPEMGYGTGTSVNIQLTPVAESNGTLTVDVWDNFTVSSAEAPHVKGAEVALYHPSTGNLVANGVTGEDGTFTFDVPGGYYYLKASAANHSSYPNPQYDGNGVVFVDPGLEKVEVILLECKTVSVDYSIEETEISDQYEIVTTVTYETEVPIPVIFITGPKNAEGEDMRVGDSKLLYFTLTNEGLINAENVTFVVPSNSEWQMRALDYTTPFTLGAKQSVLVPVMLTRLSYEQQSPDTYSYSEPFINKCVANTVAYYEYLFGPSYRQHYSSYLFLLESCSSSTISDIVGGCSGGGGQGGYSPGGGPTGPGGSTWIGPEHHDDELTETSRICNPVIVARIDKMLTSVSGLFAPTDVMNGAKGIVDQENANGRLLLKDYAPLGRLELSSIYNGMLPVIANGQITIEDIWSYKTVTDRIAKNKKNRDSESNEYGWIEVYDEHLALACQQYSFAINALEMLYGNEIWYNGDDSLTQPFWNTVATMEDVPSMDDLRSIKPANVSIAQLMSLMSRVANTYNGSTDMPQVDIDQLNHYCEAYMAYDEWAQEQGYETMTDLFKASYKVYADRMDTIAGVCTEVKLEIKQELSMARQAFRGTLKVHNGYATYDLQDAKLTLTVTDPDGNLVDERKFTITPEEKEGFEGEMDLQSGWTLAANADGKVQVLYIPTKYAAPTEPVVYTFGGSFSYFDPSNETHVSVRFATTQFTVNPLQNLVLDYFLQRDIYGDDPLTDEIEPMQDAEFALLIDNQGNGDAKNLQIITSQPEIIENNSGLLIDFNFVGSAVNGTPVTPNISDGKIITNFGTLPAHEQTYAQWFMQCSLLGHFTDYKVEVNHVTSYGNEYASLIDTARIHELIHGFTTTNAADQQMRGFLVNDLVDMNDEPDGIYFTDASHSDVAISTATLTRINDTQYALHVYASAPGWNYGSIIDPTNGKLKVASVVRQSDGKPIFDDNIWTTDRTLLDATTWLYENRVHYIVDVTGSQETYVIYFNPKPEPELAVESFGNIPDVEDVLFDPLEHVTVIFNKPIKAETFTTNDIALICQGEHIDVSTVVITQLSETTFDLDLSAVTGMNGYYVLTVQTAGILDIEGFNGAYGKQAAWKQIIGGVVPLRISIQPSQGGSVSPEDGDFGYNTTITLSASPEPGYTFLYWMDGDQIISYDSECEYTLLENSSLVAVFQIIKCNVQVTFDENEGNVVNGISRICDYGTELTFEAEPAEGYVFVGWMVNDEMVSTDPVLAITVDEDVVIKPIFKPIGAPDASTAPVIDYEITEDAVIITATGEGDVKLYVNGELVENPCTIDRGEQDMAIVVTATAQQEGMAISEVVTLEITIPAVVVTPPEPEVTATPEITLAEIALSYVVFHVEGDGVITVWVNGEEVTLDDNGDYVLYADKYMDMTYVVTATAQEPGKEVSETAELIIVVPAHDDTGLNEVNGDKSVVRVRYFNMIGQEMDQPNGMTLIVTTYSDGSISTVKVKK